jgi:hypothetical protein
LPQSIRRAGNAGAARRSPPSRGLLYGSYLDLWDFHSQPDYAALAARECGVMVSSRMDWDHLAPTPSETKFTEVDQDYDWARAHDMKFRGHALVWGERAPHWFADLPSRAAAVDALEKPHRRDLPTFCRAHAVLGCRQRGDPHRLGPPGQAAAAGLPRQDRPRLSRHRVPYRARQRPRPRASSTTNSASSSVHPTSSKSGRCCST